MNTLYDVFARRANDAGSPDLDVHALVGLGEGRLRHRRLAVVLASATTIAAGLALVFGLTLNDRVSREQGPVDRPPPREETPSMREIVYGDVEQGADGLSGETVHFGDRVVETGSGFLHIDVTDDGFVYLTDEGRRLWFSDGGEPEQIGSDVCGDDPGFPGVQVRTSNAGSLVAWFDCSGPEHATLVVFDTSLGREVVRRPVAGCGVEAPFSGCHPDDIIGDHVYFTRAYFLHGDQGRAARSTLEFDRATGRVTAAHSYLDDVRSHPRGLVVGATWETGTPTTGTSFLVVGSRLVPVDYHNRVGGEPVVTQAFDTATGRRVRLQMPAGYHGAEQFGSFEWLDDDTLALVGPTGWDNAPGYGDIITCRLSDGRCDLTVRGHGPVRVVANGGLPG